MRPESVRIWRKARRAAAKGAKRGRRRTHTAVVNPPRRRSTWLRRHPGELAWSYYLENAR